MSKFEELAAVRWTVGIVGGLIVFIAVALLLGFFLRNMFEGVPPLDIIVGFILPNAIALYCGYRSFRQSVWPRKHELPPGHCRTCGHNLTGNVSGICPECGTPCKPTAENSPGTS